jgi:hypothetical protein
MHPEILSEKQKSILPMLAKFPEFYLAGGTGLALQLGHRKSVDFDLFSEEEIHPIRIINRLKDVKIEQTLVKTIDELTIMINSVKVSFISYPFHVTYKRNDVIQIPIASPLSIGVMKAYAMGRRARWKDYVDIYFLVRQLGLPAIIKESEKMFGSLFNEKIFRVQLCYHDDLDTTEKIEYISGGPTDDEVRNFLCTQSVL